MIPPRVHVDFETRSICDLRTKGATMYAQHWTTSPTMLSFIGYGIAEVFDFMGDPLSRYQSSVYPTVQREDDPRLQSCPPPCPTAILKAIAEGAIFVAHNARFEQEIWYWICHLKWGWPMPQKWSCTAARSRYNGLRASLAGSGSDLEIDMKKFEREGDTFIKDFCIPRKYKGPKKNGIITLLWKEPQDDPEGWTKGKEYCLQDAYAEMEIDSILPDLPKFEQDTWELDFTINTRGIPIDVGNVARAIDFSDHFTQQGMIRFNEITGLYPTQRDRVLEYLNQREEIENLGDLRTKTLTRLSGESFPQELRDVIAIRVEAARASVKKLDAMAARTSPDGFARGCFLWYGAHTGRWTAKGIQPQNFVRGDAREAEKVFDFLQSLCWEQGLDLVTHLPKWVEEANLKFFRPLQSLSKSLRGFIKAIPEHELIAGDYAQIEARVLAWLANCTSLLESFATGEDVYVRFAGDHMYNRPYASYFDEKGEVYKHVRDERQRAKSAVLGAGYQLGGKGFQAYCDAMDIFLTEDEAKAIINTYRSAYPEIAHPQFGLWKRVQHCAIEAVLGEGNVVSLHGAQVTFHVERLDSERWWLRITLPSGSRLSYYRPRVDSVDKWGNPVLTYRTEWNSKSYREQTYGGKLVENIVQAIARDICAIGALNAEKAGYPVIMLVHDEVVTMPRRDSGLTAAGLREEMLRLPAWTAGLPLNAEAGRMIRYGK